jgi:Flp pilus assembly pilin Flp
MRVEPTPSVLPGADFAQEVCTAMQKFYSLLAQDEGQTMAEYSIVLTVITLAALTAFVLLGAASTGALRRVADLFT